MVTIENVIEVLNNAVSQNVEYVKLAEAQLQACKQCPNFYSMLAEVLDNYSINSKARWMAIVIIEQAVKLDWRLTTVGVIDEQQKEVLRQKLLTTVINEPDRQLVDKMALVISEIASLDYPTYWTGLIGKLRSFLITEQSSSHLTISSDPTVLQEERVLITLREIVKRLAPKVLPTGRLIFQDLTNSLYENISQIWKREMQSYANRLHLFHLQKVTLTLSILKNLIVYGSRAISMNMEVTVKNDLLLNFEFINQMATMRETASDHKTIKFIENYVSASLKLLFKLFNHLVNYFLQHFLEPTINLIIRIAFLPENSKFCFMKIKRKCILLFSNILTYVKKSRKLTTIETSAFEAVKKIVYDDEILLKNMIENLITNYLRLTNDDVELWSKNPEQFLIKELYETDPYSCRVLAIQLLKSFWITNNDNYMKVISELLLSVRTPTEAISLEAALLKEAVYKSSEALGYLMAMQGHFEEWLEHIVTVEMKMTDRNACIIQRRLMHTLVLWTNMIGTRNADNVIFEILYTFLKGSSDYVLRFTACVCLRDFTCVVFDNEAMRSHTKGVMDSLIELLTQTNECELKIEILKTITYVITGSLSQTLIVFQQFEMYIPMLWSAYEENVMLKCQLISILVKTTQNLFSKCDYLFKYAVPIIKVGIDLTNPNHIYIVEPSLELWMNILRHTKNNDAKPLMELCPQLASIIKEYNADYFFHCCKITEEYVLIDANYFLNNFGCEIFEALCSSLPILTANNINHLFSLLNAAFILEPEVTSRIAMTLFTSFYKYYIVDTEPKSTFMSFFFALSGQIMLQSISHFCQCVQNLSNNINVPFEQVLQKIIDIWIQVLNGYCTLTEIKLFVMAMCQMLLINCPEVITKNMASILNCIFYNMTSYVSTCADLGGEYDPLFVEGQENAMDTLNSMFDTSTSLNDSNGNNLTIAEAKECDSNQKNSNNSVDYVNPEVLHEVRTTRLNWKSPIYKIDLRHYITKTLHELKKIYPMNLLKEYVRSIKDDYQNDLVKYFALPIDHFS